MSRSQREGQELHQTHAAESRGETLVEDLEQAIRRYVLDELPSPSARRVRTKPTRHLLQVYGSWLDRQISQRPRQVLISRELLADSRLEDNGPGLAVLLRKMAFGEDLNPYRSHRSREAYRPGKQPAVIHQRADRDLLLAEWGIHHLHLSSEPDPKNYGFNGRTELVLFVAFRPDRAYVIGLYEHPSQSNWASKRIAETLVRNWPDQDFLVAVDGAIGLESEYTDDERLNLRNAGVTVLLEIDGKVHMPRGLSSDGGSVDIAMHVIRVVRSYEQYRDREKDLVALLDGAVEGQKPSENSRWVAFAEDCRYGFRRAGVAVTLGELVRRQ